MWWLCYERNAQTVAVVIVEASSLIHAQMHAALAALGAFPVGHRLDAHCIAQLAPEDLRRNLSPAEADALLERFAAGRTSGKKPPAPSNKRRERVAGLRRIM